MIIFDVGANNGSQFIREAEINSDVVVYAFEPTPRMCEIIKSKSSSLGNYHLIEKAVSDFEGTAQFKVAGQRDWGCSSLLEFSDKSRTEWLGRTDFKVTEVIDVGVIRLDGFIEQNKIDKIDYLHVDTQGSDLRVLLGLGSFISIVRQGVIEAANKEEILYIGQNKKEECVDFLEKNNFNINSITCNDEECNEVNIFFEAI